MPKRPVPPVEYDLQQPGVTKPFIDSLQECTDSTVGASIKPHDKIKQLSSNMSECKEEIAKNQIQAPEKSFINIFSRKKILVYKQKIDGMPEADKEHKQVLNYEEQKVDGIMKILKKYPTLSGIRRIGKFDSLKERPRSLMWSSVTHGMSED